MAGSGSRRIDCYVANGMSLGGAQPEASLVGNLATLQEYDVVLLPCAGGAEDAQYASNVGAYAGAGGRVMTTHHGYAWWVTPTNGATNPFFEVASWNLASPNAPSAVDSTVDTALPDGGSLPSGPPAVEVALLDTGTTGAFNLATPPVVSGNDLRLTVTLNPTSDAMALRRSSRG